MFPVTGRPRLGIVRSGQNDGPVCVKLIASPSASESENAWSAVDPATTVMFVDGGQHNRAVQLMTVAVSDSHPSRQSHR